MKMPAKVIELLNDPEATKVLTSVSSSGIPHSVVIGSTMSPEPELICAAEILMKKTSANLKKNPNVCVLAVKGTESYQVTATVQGHKDSGPIFDRVKTELEKKGMSCRGVWLFKPNESFNQSAGPDAGNRIDI